MEYTAARKHAGMQRLIPLYGPVIAGLRWVERCKYFPTTVLGELIISWQHRVKWNHLPAYSLLNSGVLMLIHHREQGLLWRVRTSLTASVAATINRFGHSSEKGTSAQRGRRTGACAKTQLAECWRPASQRCEWLITLAPKEHFKNERVFKQQVPFSELDSAMSRTAAFRRHCCPQVTWPGPIRALPKWN